MFYNIAQYNIIIYKYIISKIQYYMYFMLVSNSPAPGKHICKLLISSLGRAYMQSVSNSLGLAPAPGRASLCGRTPTSEHIWQFFICLLYHIRNFTCFGLSFAFGLFIT